MTKDNIKKLFAHIFFVLIFTFCCFNMSSNTLTGYFAANTTAFVFLKFLVILVCTSIATIIEYKASKGSDFIAIAAPIISNIAFISFAFDYYVTEISGTIFLFKIMWAAYLMFAQVTLFFVVTICAKHEKHSTYQVFFKNLWYGFTPLFIFVFCVCFARSPFSNEAQEINYIPFEGTFLMLYAMLDHMRGGIEPPILFFGNIVFFMPYGFLVPFYLKKSHPVIHLLVGIITPFLIESYQYFFKCGHADIDDLILNISGFLIGYLMFYIVKKYTEKLKKTP